MAKKQKTQKVVEPLIEKDFEEVETMEETVTEFFEEPVVEEPKARERLKPSNEWEIKDRIYYLKSGKKPLSRSIRSTGIFYFDEEKGYEREIKYCENQRTVFVDEMKGQHVLSHITFRNGMLIVPREKRIYKFIHISTKDRLRKRSCCFFTPRTVCAKPSQ